MDALEFYIGELADVARQPVNSMPDRAPTLDEAMAYIEHLREAANSVVTAWDAENTPESCPGCGEEGLPGDHCNGGQPVEDWPESDDKDRGPRGPYRDEPYAE